MLLTYESVIADGDKLKAADNIWELFRSDKVVSSSGEVTIVVFTRS